MKFDFLIIQIFKFIFNPAADLWWNIVVEIVVSIFFALPSLPKAVSSRLETGRPGNFFSSWKTFIYIYLSGSLKASLPNVLFQTIPYNVYCRCLN